MTDPKFVNVRNPCLAIIEQVCYDETYMREPGKTADRRMDTVRKCGIWIYLTI